MTLHTKDLKEHLESVYGYQIVGLLDLDFIVTQPQNVLYAKFKELYKESFESNERIVLFSRETVTHELLAHIQKCTSFIDISNFFILICSSTPISLSDLDDVRKTYSSDDNVFPTLSLSFNDNVTPAANNKLFALPDSFCFNPWAQLEINNLGEFKPCCVYSESITDSNGIPYNVATTSVTEVYRSEYLNTLREQFRNGQKPVGCAECWYKESVCNKSNRHWSTSHLGINALCLDVEKDSETNLISLDLKLGNLCNFKCRICDATSSSRVAEEQVRHYNQSENVKSIKLKGQWVDDPLIWEMFETFGGQLVNIDFYGGEPFLIKQHEKFLDYLVKNNHSEKVRLHYNSNGSVFPSQLLESWKLFREVNIAFSIDNIGNRFELERGGSWQEVDRNLDRFLNSALPNMSLSVFVTVNVQNVYYLDEIINWAETKKFSTVILSILRSPDHFSINSMNNELALAVIARLQQIETNRMEKYNIHAIIHSLKEGLSKGKSVDKLASVMLKLDHIRNQQFSQTHPEVANIIFKGK